MAADAMSDSNGSDEDTTSPAIADTDIETDSAESIGDIETDTDHPGDDANPASSEQKQ